MWATRREVLEGGRVEKIRIEQEAIPISFADVLQLWQHDDTFRAFFNHLLANVHFAAFRWETPPLSTATSKRDFEFVVLDSPGLARRPDSQPFAKYFPAATDDVVSFTNLGKDATLVVPVPAGPTIAYGHLASFVRQAPPAQQHALWKLVGRTTENALGNAPIWLSTAGAGVSWLHVRVDSTPKYYGYHPYRQDI